MIFLTTDRIPDPPRALLEGPQPDPQTLEAHHGLCADLPALSCLETSGLTGSAPLSLPLRVAAWNLERCLFPEASALALQGADVVLLSEMDVGMARTAQRHTPVEIGRKLGMAHAFGVEFVELGLGSETERSFCLDDFNTRGFHGNAVLAKAPLICPFLVRLPGQGRWYLNAGQPRLGGRIAMGARIETSAGPIIFVSTHLESACEADHRAAQMQALIGALDTAFPGLPVLIGGDLNTGNHTGGDWRAEGLFAVATAAGFTRHGGPEDQPTTRPSLITRFPDRALKLDWFLARGLTLGETFIRPGLDAAGRPLSDHDRIETTVLGVLPATS